VITEPARVVAASLPASFLRRVGAHLIDVVGPGVAVLVVVAGLARTGHRLLASGVLVLGFLAWLALLLWNTGFRQGVTGQSIGKRALGLRLVGADSGLPVGFGRSVVRQIAHFIDLLPFPVGYLWPVWDERRQTFADKVCAAVVVRVEG